MTLKTFEIRDERNKVFSVVTKPTVLFEKSTGIVQKIGEYEMVQSVYELMYNQYKEHGFDAMADDLFVMDLPEDQDIIDKVFQITGFLKKMIDDGYFKVSGAVQH